jgi:hypothetical protein
MKTRGINGMTKFTELTEFFMRHILQLTRSGLRGAVEEFDWMALLPGRSMSTVAAAVRNFFRPSSYINLSI